MKNSALPHPWIITRRYKDDRILVSKNNSTDIKNEYLRELSNLKSQKITSGD